MSAAEIPSPREPGTSAPRCPVGPRQEIVHQRDVDARGVARDLVVSGRRVRP
jgi:hypothetical protein